MKKITWLAAMLMWLFIHQTAFAFHSAGHQEAGPSLVLKEGMGKLVAFLKSKNANDPVAKLSFVEKEIAPYFDFNYMAKWAAGSAYRKMSAGQKTNMSNQIKSMLLNTLSKHLKVYSNQQIRYFRPRYSRGEVSIGVGILKGNGYRTNLNFRFYKSKSGWKIFDVKANGRSAVTYYRSYFNKMRRARR